VWHWACERKGMEKKYSPADYGVFLVYLGNRDEVLPFSQFVLEFRRTEYSAPSRGERLENEVFPKPIKGFGGSSGERR